MGSSLTRELSGCGCWVLILLLFLSVTSYGKEFAQNVDAKTFVTRPDIEVPRWNITTYDPEKLSTGYWFISPIVSSESLDQSGGNLTAPMIFDGNGGLIWSGAHLSERYNTFDFRVSKVLGQDMLTFLYPRNRSAILVDNTFSIFKQLQIASMDSSEIDNTHELNFVHNGTRALFFYDRANHASTTQSKAIGFSSGRCLIRENTFREADLTDDDRFVYRWSASKRIDLDESTATEGTIEQRCNETAEGWDWAQANSVDKFARDGSYLLSAGYTNTIYKIFRSGDIAWRLGGNQSDFQADFTFSRQSHARIQSHNDTHTVISFFDNADPADSPEPDQGVAEFFGSAGPKHGAAKSSRGLLVALRTDIEPMTATLLVEYKQPSGSGSGSDAAEAGSMQVLPNGNVFMAWADGLRMSEHDANGRVLMEAHVAQEWLRSYRSYKFPFVGQPEQPPDVYAEVGQKGEANTTVYVSWNGATEVESWNVYRASKDGKVDARHPLASAPRSGFETKIQITGYAKRVVVEAVDKDGTPLGRSHVFHAVGSSRKTGDNAMGDSEEQDDTMPTLSGSGKSWQEAAKSRSGIASFFAAIAVLAGLALAFYLWRRRRRTSWTSQQGKHTRRPSEHEMSGSYEVLYTVDGGDEVEHEVDKNT